MVFIKKRKDDKDLVILKTVKNDVEACVVESLLKSCNINCMLKYETDIASAKVIIGKTTTPVEVYVNKNDYIKAEEILSLYEVRGNEDMYEKNINSLVAFFNEGSKANNNFKLGVEVEHIVVRKDNKYTVSYYGEEGINSILSKLSEFYPKTIYEGKNLIGLAKDNAVISIEPASQLEISIGPYEKIADIKNDYEYFISKLTPILDEYEYELVNLGYHPKSKVDDLMLIPKKRYEIMDAHFKKTGNHGKNMMKGSCATQVSIDYKDEEDFIKKFRLANMLSPLFYFLCENSPIFEGEVYEGNMVRALIWKDMDSARSGVVKDALNKRFGFREYAEYIYNSPVVVHIDENNDITYTSFTKISELYKDKELTKDDIRHIISMFFPDNRLKNYIEIRMADSMKEEYILSYTAIIKGIFYDTNNVNKLLKKFEFVTNEKQREALDDLIKDGYEADVYGINAYDLLKEILSLAISSLDECEKKYVIPFKNLVDKKTTLAKEEKNKLLNNPVSIKKDRGKLV